MRNTLFSLLLLTTFASCSNKDGKETSHSTQTKFAFEQSDVQVTNLTPAFDDNKFPLVHFSKSKNVEDKINIYLQISDLEHLPGKFKKNPFEKVASATDNFESQLTNFESWSRSITLPNILSITSELDYTGAYAESFNMHYNFDLRTGNIILLNGLFTKEGYKIIAKTVNENVKMQIQKHLDKLKDPAEIAKLPSDDKEQLGDEVALFQECIEGAADYNLEYYGFRFSNDSLILERNRCSNHIDQVLDELGNIEVGLSLASIKPYLSAYGISLLNNDADKLNTDSPEGKLYKGFINGKYPIAALITTINEGSINMNYWYDKTKTPILWSGNFENDLFTLAEIDGDTEKEVAKINAKWTDNKKIIGTWTNNKTNEIMKLELEAY